MRELRRFARSASLTPVMRAALVATSAAFVLVQAGALRGADECRSTSNIGDLSNPGNPRVQAATTQQDCTGRQTYVWLRMIGLPFYCTGETWQNQCYDSSEDGNAGTQAYASAYGRWDATSTHMYKELGQYYDLPSRAITLDAGKSPREACDEAGGLWDEPSETCEWNPDWPSSPIIIALGSSAYQLTSARDGVRFDVDGDGVREQVAWTRPNARIAFLALDRDGDGYITSGKELFGNFTIPGESNGFDALARMTLESNGGIERGSVSSDDPLFSRLLLWTDTNHNGVSESEELQPASSFLSDIGLGYQNHHRRDGHGNLFRYRGWVHYRTAPGRNKAETAQEDTGRRRQIFDVFLTVLR